VHCTLCTANYRAERGFMDLRIRLIFTLFSVWFIIISGKLWLMQVLHKTVYTEMSVRNRTREVDIPSARGRIYDREGRVLVDNKAATQLVAVIDEIENRKEFASEVSSITNLSVEYILKKIKENLYKPFVPAVLASDLNEETLMKVAESRWRVPGLAIQIAPVRDYLFGETFAHIIGYVGEVGKGELNDGGYNWGDIVGRTGLEKQYDKELRGEKGYKEVQVDYKGNVDTILNVVEPKIGNSLYLTIDMDLQNALLNALKGHNGAGVVMNPNTGEVLALTGSPSYDPNLLKSPVKPEVANKLFTDKNRPMVNRAVNGVYPPGSIFKIIVALAALESGIINKDSLFCCDGKFDLGGTEFKCSEKKGHGWVDLSTAIKKSCNLYFYQIGVKVGPEKISDMARRFGLGESTGIKLPGEKKGLIPIKIINSKKWYPGDTVSLSIGQGKILVTAMQMAVLASAIANGGTIYRPYLLMGDETNLGAVVVDKKYIDIVKEGLYRVVNEPEGTGVKAAVEGLRVAGKTGTVELVEGGKKRDICWFVGYAPADNPQITAAVVIEDGASGGVSAAPVVQEVFKAWKDKNECF